MRLLRVELARVRSRPAVLVIALVTLLLAGILVGSAAYETRPVTAQERATAEQLLEGQQEQSRKELEDCQADPGAYFGDETATASRCDEIMPTLDWFLPRAQLDLGGELENRASVLMILLACVSILVGATFAGADWGSGSMSNQLLFAPQRLKVWVLKAVAVVVSCTAASAVVLAGFWGALSAVASARGITTDDATWTAILQTSGRALVLVAGVTLGGYALTMLLRHTVGTLGLLFGYAVVGEGLAASLPVDRMSQWSMAHNVMAWLHDGTEIFDQSICEGADGGSCSPFYVLGLGHAAAYLGVLLALAVAVSVVLFRRRDVP